MGKIKVFLLGGLIGAGVALAFTPRTGEQTRALVAEKASAVAGEAKDFAAGMPGSAQDVIANARQQGTSFVSDAASKVKGAAGQANEADADELRQKIEAARQRIAAQVMENAEKAQAAAEAAQPAEAAAEAEVSDKADEAKHAK